MEHGEYEKAYYGEGRKGIRCQDIHLNLLNLHRHKSGGYSQRGEQREDLCAQPSPTEPQDPQELRSDALCGVCGTAILAAGTDKT